MSSFPTRRCICGQEFQPKRGTQLCCSPACCARGHVMDRWYQRRQRRKARMAELAETVRCIGCGLRMWGNPPQRSTRRYCSHACRQRAYRQRTADAR
jgi:hypothetical protein